MVLIQLGYEIFLRSELEKGVRVELVREDQFVEHCYLQIMGLHNVVGATTRNNGIQHLSCEKCLNLNPSAETAQTEFQSAITIFREARCGKGQTRSNFQ